MFGLLQLLCTSSGAIPRPSTFYSIKKKYTMTMFAKTFTTKQQTLIKSAKGGQREATQHNTDDFPSTWSAASVPFHLFTSFNIN